MKGMPVREQTARSVSRRMKNLGSGLGWRGRNGQAPSCTFRVDLSTAALSGIGDGTLPFAARGDILRLGVSPVARDIRSSRTAEVLLLNDQSLSPLGAEPGPASGDPPLPRVGPVGASELRRAAQGVRLGLTQGFLLVLRGRERGRSTVDRGDPGVARGLRVRQRHEPVSGAGLLAASAHVRTIATG